MKHRVRIVAILTTIAALAAGYSPGRAQECVPAPEGMIGWWPGDGNAEDIVGANTGTLEGGTTFTTGKVRDAFAFDGIDDFVRLPILTFGPAYTVDAWIWHDVTGTYDAIFGLCDDPNSTCTGLDYRAAVFRVDNDGALTSGFSPMNYSARRLVATTAAHVVQPARWQHVATTVDSTTNTIAIFVDGVQQAVDLDNVGSGPGSFQGAPFMGARNIIFNQTVERPFPGMIDEVEYFDRALTEAEIHAIHEAGPAGKCKDDDNDGFRPPEDCDEADASVNPAAAELPGNYVDENCDGDLGDCSPCNAWRNHGEYIRCTSQAVNELVTAGLLTEEDGDELVSSAARSDVGKKSFVRPPECP